MSHKEQIRETIVEETFISSDNVDTGLDTEMDGGMEKGMDSGMNSGMDTRVSFQSGPGEYSGVKVSHQQQLIESLARLYQSLLGPNDLLDREGYSRPFPPPTPAVRQSFRRR